MNKIANRSELARLFTGYGAEIGVLRGEYSQVILQFATKLFCVDPYKGYSNHKQVEMDEAKQTARARLEPYGVKVQFVYKTSMEAVHPFNDGLLDFVYIDGDHSWPHITQDIYWWARKIKAGGIVAGHDYFVSDWHKSVVHVLPVVDAYCKAFKLELNVTGETGVREESPSWWFIKI